MSKSFIMFWYQTDWGLYGRRNEMLARELAGRQDTNKMIHIEAPISIFRLFIYLYNIVVEDKSMRESYILHIRKALSATPISDGEVLVYTPLKLIPKESRWEFAIYINSLTVELQMRFIYEWTKSKSAGKLIGIKYPPQQYLQKMSSCFDFACTVSDLVDYHPDPSGENINTQSYESAIRSSEFSIAVSKKLAEKFEKQDTPSYHLPNGVNPSRFTRVRGPDMISNSKIAGWVGNVNQTLNFDWIKTAASENPEFEFIYIGPISSDSKAEVKELEDNYNNITFTGPKPPSKIPDALSKFKIGLVPDEMTEQAMYKDTMKLYEYFASGMPAVSSNVPPAEKFSDCIGIATNASQFSDQVSMMMTSGYNPSEFLEIAERNSWKKRADRLLSLINSHISKYKTN